MIRLLKEMDVKLMKQQCEIDETLSDPFIKEIKEKQEQTRNEADKLIQDQQVLVQEVNEAKRDFTRDMHEASKPVSDCC